MAVHISGKMLATLLLFGSLVTGLAAAGTGTITAQLTSKQLIYSGGSLSPEFALITNWTDTAISSKLTSYNQYGAVDAWLVPFTWTLYSGNSSSCSQDTMQVRTLDGVGPGYIYNLYEQNAATYYCYEATDQYGNSGYSPTVLIPGTDGATATIPVNTTETGGSAPTTSLATTIPPSTSASTTVITTTTTVPTTTIPLNTTSIPRSTTTIAIPRNTTTVPTNPGSGGSGNVIHGIISFFRTLFRI